MARYGATQRAVRLHAGNTRALAISRDGLARVSAGDNSRDPPSETLKTSWIPNDQKALTVASVCGTTRPLHGLACLVLAHENAGQIALLVRWLERQGARCYVHVDLRAADTRTELAALVSPGSRVLSAEESHRVEWGGFAMIGATLALMRAAVREAPDARAMVLLSGTHLPIREAAAIGVQLLDGREHIDLAFAAAEPADHMSLRRFWYLSLPGREERRPFLRWVNSNTWRLGRRDLASGLRGMTPMVGSQWWCLSAACVRHILAFLEANAWYERFFRYASIPDETFFHTLVGASRFAANRAPSPLYQMKTGYSPCVLTVADLPAAVASGMPFARKFDTRVDADAVRMALEMADGHCPAWIAERDAPAHKGREREVVRDARHGLPRRVGDHREACRGT